MLGYQIKFESGYGDEYRSWTMPVVFTDYAKAKLELDLEATRQQLDCAEWSDCNDPLDVFIRQDYDTFKLVSGDGMDYITVSLRTVKII